MTQETSKTDLTIFNFEDHGLRSITDEQGNPWFVLRDVLEAMGSTTRPADAASSIEETLGDGVVKNYPILDALGRTQTVTVIRALLEQFRGADSIRVESRQIRLGRRALLEQFRDLVRIGAIDTAKTAARRRFGWLIGTGNGYANNVPIPTPGKAMAAEPRP